MGLIGGDSGLSDLGIKYSKSLAKFFRQESQNWGDYKDEIPLVYCSTMLRALQTAEKLSFIYDPIVMKSLDEISSGLRDGMTYDEIKERFPEEHEERNKDKLNYRYPRGESYMDVISRIEPMIYEIERRKGPVIIVGHQGMIRCLYGYFACINIDKIPTLEIPLHCVVKFIPEAYGFDEERIIIDPLTDEVTRLCGSEINQRYIEELSHVPNKD